MGKKKPLKIVAEYEIRPGIKKNTPGDLVLPKFIFIHHFGGHKQSFVKIMDFLNELGFDCIAFDLPNSKMIDLVKLPLSQNWKFGARHVWAEKIEQTISQIPGPKIFYSFSSPSSSALMAMANDPKREAIAWICDGGPFAHLVDGIENLVKEWNVTEKKKLRRFLAGALTFIWGGLQYEKEMKAALSRLPKHFPVLSYRAEKDHLVSPKMIDDFFALSSNLNVTAVHLPHSGHLRGFKEDSDIYFRELKKFVSDVCTKKLSN